MALRHTRLISKVFQNRVPTICQIGRRGIADNSAASQKVGSLGAPYRPSPFDKPEYPKSAEYWEKQYPTQSAEADQYEEEEVYLDQIEERMRQYDKKYSHTEEIKKLYNEFGWSESDDRAYYTYGGGLSSSKDELQYGRGKKLDPAQYVNSDFTHVMRKSVPPIEYLTAEQVRRSRGSLSNFREVPPETPSIWKYWNGISTIGVFTAFIITKEYFVLWGHDMWDALLYWCIFGIAGSVAGDWLAWWHALMAQEQYDRQFFQLQQRVDKTNDQIEALATKPNERVLLFDLLKYREELSEKVLKKTLANRVSRIMDKTLQQLNDKVSEELAIKAEAERQWQRDALDATVEYFNESKVQSDFMQEAIQQFSQPNVASLKQSSTNVNMQNSLFEAKYQEFYNSTKNQFLKDQKAAGKLNLVFADEKAQKATQMSAAAKQKECASRIKQWEAEHNPIGDVPLPSFA